MKSSPVGLRPILTAGALVIGVPAGADGLPLAARLTDLPSSPVLFREAFHGPAVGRMLLILVGVVASGTALRRSLRPLCPTVDTADR
ncbi:hypothetical protein [Streptomyces sp. CMB-StM0423]|uniref:hypothetical protein n=1 Tax=Streptomyces sp. CMB-StM0423 TaxID=2059884 RepID=UPI00131C0BC7|nr:hypothetical protein [Streptomyces sp. CMB-StM0423]